MSDRKPTAEVVAELRREIAIRERVYPKWIREQRITDAQARHGQDCLITALAMIQEIERGELVPRDTRPHAAPELFTPGEAEIRRSERLKIMEVLARSVPTATWIRANAAVKREFGE